MLNLHVYTCICIYIHWQQFPGGGYPKLMGVAWHNKWENFGLITSAEGLVRELIVYDKISLVNEKVVNHSSL